MMNPFKNKKGLGRGLSSLIGDVKATSQNNKLALSDIVRNKLQPRKNLIRLFKAYARLGHELRNKYQIETVSNALVFSGTQTRKRETFYCQKAILSPLGIS